MSPTASPFTASAVKTAGATDNDEFSLALPVTQRVGRYKDGLVVAQLHRQFLRAELVPDQLNKLQNTLWLCGRPMPPRPLHYQVLHSRAITICEDIDHHLVWHRDRIFLKPLPRYLLESRFWDKHLSLADKDENENDEQIQIVQAARGLLFSYAALVSYRSDFDLALEHGLLPSDMAWDTWRSLATEVVQNHQYNLVSPRYWYGELRLSRLNKVSKLSRGSLFRGFSSVGAHVAYGDLLYDNFATLAAILGYVVVALTAMQVGLGVDKLQTNPAFMQASYGFTIFSIIAPLILVVAIFVLFFAYFAFNWKSTKIYESKRFVEMGVRLNRQDANWERQRTKETSQA